MSSPRQPDSSTTATFPAVGDGSGSAAARATSAGRPGSLASAPGGLPPRPGGAPVGSSGAGNGAATRPAAARPQVPRPARRAQLTLRRFNVWSVFKFSCILSIALFAVWMIAIGVLYGVVDAAGVVKSINDAVTTVNGEGSSAPIQAGQVLGVAAIVGVVNMVLFIALASLFAVIYNLISDFVGGVEVTLSERD